MKIKKSDKKIKSFVESGYIYFIKPTQITKNPYEDRLDERGVAVYLEKNSDGTYDVYRTTYYISFYPNLHYVFSSGWNLYSNLSSERAIKAAKNALKYID